MKMHQPDCKAGAAWAGSGVAGVDSRWPVVVSVAPGGGPELAGAACMLHDPHSLRRGILVRYKDSILSGDQCFQITYVSD